MELPTSYNNLLHNIRLNNNFKIWHDLTLNPSLRNFLLRATEFA